jgi:hypothetical protein
MQSYSFSVALRFWHPHVDPRVITTQLGIPPEISVQANLPRFTPKGTPLEGVYRETHWHAQPCARWRESAELDAEQAVLELLPQLAPHGPFIHQLLATGGRALIHVSSYGPGNYALVFTPELMAKCAGLGLSLAHDVYQVAQA